MGPLMVIEAAVVFDDDTGFSQCPEGFSIEAFISETAVEALDEAILPRAAGIYIECLDLVGREPALYFMRNELGAVVAAQELWRSVLANRFGQPLQYVLGFQRASRAHAALACVWSAARAIRLAVAVAARDVCPPGSLPPVASPRCVDSQIGDIPPRELSSGR